MAGDSSRHHDKIEKLRLLKSSKQYQLTLAQLFWSQQHYIALEHAVLPSPCWTTAGSGWRANPGEGRGRRATRTSKKLDKTLLCWNNILVQLWGGLTWMLLAVNVLWIDSLENWHQESSSRHSLQPLSNQLKKKKEGFPLADENKGSLFQVSTLCSGYTTFKTMTNSCILLMKASLSFRTLWSWKISSNVCLLKRLESRTLVSFCLSVLLRVLF